MEEHTEDAGQKLPGLLLLQTLQEKMRRQDPEYWKVGDCKCDPKNIPAEYATKNILGKKYFEGL